MLLCSEHRTNIDTLQVLCSSTSRVAQSLNMLTSRFSCINQFMDHTDVGQMKPICRLIEKDLSEPYSIFTYRYFIYNWPKLCVMVIPTGRSGIFWWWNSKIIIFLSQAYDGDEMIGVIVCKADVHKGFDISVFLAWFNFACWPRKNSSAKVRPTTCAQTIEHPKDISPC